MKEKSPDHQPVARLPITQGKSQLDFRSMVESVADYGIFFLDTQGFVQTWNIGAEKIKGYRAHEIIGKHFSVFYPAELNERNWPNHELAVAREVGRFEDEGWRIRKDGTRFWANIIITRLSNEAGEFIGFSKITRDLSERRRQEELLRLSEERFRLLVEGVKDYAIFMLDPEGRIASWNLGAKLNKGYEEAEILGKHFSVFYPADALAAGLPDLELKIAKREGRFEDEGWRIRKDGSRFWANVVITALYDASGVHRGFAKVTRDLTEKRKIILLEDEGRQITKFLAMLGHELRNPLAPISNAVTVLSMEKTTSDRAQQMQDIIGRQVGHMTQIVDDLLDVSRIKSGKITLDRKPIKINDIAVEALETVQSLAHRKMHTLNFSPTATSIWVSGDRTRLVQTVVNLLTNAIKFTPEHGTIDLTIRLQSEKVEISVKDNGVGIPPSSLSTIFGLFEQGEQDLARTQGGLGLGLSLVNDLVALHGGEVAAYSSGTSGSEFIIFLPVINAPMERSPRVRQSNDIVEKKRILVVDDNEDAANTMALLLQVLGFETQVAYSGADAINRIKSDTPDLILMDIGLPDISGIEVAKRISRETIDPPPLIAVTGYGQETDRTSSLKAGFVAHLTKPVDVTAMADLLKKLLK
ncbi:MAG: sensor hybrid histidine kinase [Verrucomicrobiaceae bacterium]|nr:sensor hybrid histidine kinase [Verrucomicrobiaceae bacterium]